jgi:hypothetical protein
MGEGERRSWLPVFLNLFLILFPTHQIIAIVVVLATVLHV